jgi:lysine/ornithine N-monooxygenase
VCIKQMPFSARHRFMKAYGLHYSWKMTIEDIARYSGIEESVLQAIYDQAYTEFKTQSKSMNAVYMHCNHNRTEAPVVSKRIQFHEGVVKFSFD